MIGYLGSGYLITLYGARVTFYIHAVACVVVSVFFICVSLVCMCGVLVWLVLKPGEKKCRSRFSQLIHDPEV